MKFLQRNCRAEHRERLFLLITFNHPEKDAPKDRNYIKFRKS